MPDVRCSSGSPRVHEVPSGAEALSLPSPLASNKDVLGHELLVSTASKSVSGGSEPGDSEPGTTPRIVVAAAILDDLSAPTRVLGAERSYPEQWRGYFEFPGGKVEPGETPELALRRELREELSLEVELGERLPGTWPAHGGYDMYVYLAVLLPGTRLVPGRAHLSLQWADLRATDSLRWLPADYPILAALRAHYQETV